MPPLHRGSGDSRPSSLLRRLGHLLQLWLRFFRQWLCPTPSPPVAGPAPEALPSPAEGMVLPGLFSFLRGCKTGGETPLTIVCTCAYNKGMTIEKVKCKRCGYVWYPRAPELPKYCANKKCRSPYWQTERWKGIKKQPPAGGQS